MQRAVLLFVCTGTAGGSVLSKNTRLQTHSYIENQDVNEWQLPSVSRLWIVADCERRVVKPLSRGSLGAACFYLAFRNTGGVEHVVHLNFCASSCWLRWISLWMMWYILPTAACLSSYWSQLFCIHCGPQIVMKAFCRQNKILYWKNNQQLSSNMRADI